MDCYQCFWSPQQLLASFRKVVLSERTPLSSQYFLSLQKFVVIERDLVLLPVANSDEVGKILAQMVFLERKPQNNPYRIKMKPTPIDKALLTTLQAVPGLGQKKALSLLTQYGSIEQISKASTASLSTVVGKANAQQVKDFFQQAIHGGKRRSTLFCGKYI
ncbi:Fanconi anemia core complex-associated protein 24-like isoform X1 [Acropora palmata]|uniref:Fanconi anemia core complex-associated protein 24-like isoform X1 n=1 Tax=Acropora palmata TaxID=6131 RepID=UPI003DA023D4